MREQGFLLFWRSPGEALFAPDVIACIRNVGVANLERERQKNIGPKYLKVGNRVLYRKSDVLEWIALHEKESALAIAALNRLGCEDADTNALTKSKAPPPKRRLRRAEPRAGAEA
jgi:hypothetical protein